ncbi:hypothetical protein BKA62DRAFT_90806 [Auriculariales sp. MPI-PUGE-AT-0066]|nr:hypothetical protein BKA62DRAFT_90806 [Auriculariales sp. MPI-PUGE-AT-0066]
MLAFTVLTTFLALAPGMVSAGLNKGIAYSKGLHDPFIKLEQVKSVSAKSRKSSVPDVCKQYGKGPAFGMAGDIKCDVSKMQAREVTFGDCGQSWTLCRCPDANLSMDQLQQRVGQIPPGIRSYVGAFLATKSEFCNAVTFNGDFIRVHGKCGSSVMLHEAGHALDDGFSGSKKFKDALNKDKCVPDSYANTNTAEDFAQLTVMEAYETRFKKLPGHPSCLHNQMMTLRKDKRIQEAMKAKKCLPKRRPFTTKNTLKPKRLVEEEEEAGEWEEREYDEDDSDLFEDITIGTVTVPFTDVE